MPGFFLACVNLGVHIPSTPIEGVVESGRKMHDADVMPPVTGFGTASAETLDDFDAVVRVHQEFVYRVIASLVREPDAADTLTQECFLRAFQKRDTFRGEASMRTWLLAIAVNLARDHARNRRAGFWKRLFTHGTDADEIADSLPDRQPRADEVLVAREQVNAVWKALGQLPERQRTVFTLRFVNDLSLEQIAAATGTTVGTVKTHLSRAVGTLREITGRRK